MAIVPTFVKASRQKCKASILIDGLSGRGKTGLALAMAHILNGGDWETIAVVDTENRSLPLYCGVKLHTGATVPNGALNIGYLTEEDGFRPTHYAAYRDAAIKAGFGTLVCDSISHMWQYKGGILDLVTRAQQENARLNKWTVWGLPDIVQEKLMILSLIRHEKLHCINTVRVKEKMELIEEDGKKIIKSLGEQQLAMPELKYEPDLSISLQKPGSYEGDAPVALIDKSRYPMLKVGDTYAFTKELIEQIRLFLEEGTSPEELLEQQRQDYVTAISEYLDLHETAKSIWPSLKDQNGVKDAKLADIPLPVLKILFGQLIA